MKELGRLWNGRKFYPQMGTLRIIQCCVHVLQVRLDDRKKPFSSISENETYLSFLVSVFTTRGVPG
jgi:hypothetical protein